MLEAKKCNHVLETGERCGSYAQAGKGLCFVHDPQNKEAHLDACRRGGSVKQTTIKHDLKKVTDIENPHDVIRLLSTTIEEVRAGKIDPKVANTIGYLSSHLLKAFEVANLEGKVEELQAVLLDRDFVTPKGKNGKTKRF